MKKNYENYILYALLIIIVVGLIYSFSGFFKNDNKMPPNDIIDDKGFKTISSGSTGPGEVSIDLTPQGFNNGKLDVKMAVNTHSIELEPFDLKKITTLEYNGKIINPVEVPSLSGHHSSGNLIFDVGKEVNNFVIKIKGIPKIEERVFEW